MYAPEGLPWVEPPGGWPTHRYQTLQPALTRAFTLTTALTFNSSLTTSTEPNCTACPEVVHRAVSLITISEAFVFYSLSLIIPAGSVCNMLALVTFLTRRMRKQSSCWYLAVLAMADTLMLVTELFRQWLPNSRINVNWYNENNVACMVISYLSLTARALSSWTIVMFTIERMVCVVWPLSGILKIANVVMAKKIIALVVVVCSLFGVYIICLSVVRMKGFTMECTSIERHTDLYNILSLVWILFSTFLPVTAVFILNSITIHRLNKLKQKRSDLFSQKNYEYAINKNKITVMLLTVSTCFVVLSTPYLILWIYVNRQTFTDATEYHTVQAILAIVRVFYVLNFAINLALYSITGSKFRRQLLLVVTCRTDDMSSDSSSLRRRSTQQGVGLQALRRKSTHGTMHNVVSKAAVQDKPDKQPEGMVQGVGLQALRRKSTHGTMHNVVSKAAVLDKPDKQPEGMV